MAFSICRYHSTSGVSASVLAGLLSQNSRNVPFAITRTASPPVLGDGSLRTDEMQPYKCNAITVATACNPIALTKSFFGARKTLAEHQLRAKTLIYPRTQFHQIPDTKKPDIKSGFLNYIPVKKQRETKIRLERVKGIEPSLSAWEAGVMPLYDTRSERLTLYQMCAWK